MYELYEFQRKAVDGIKGILSEGGTRCTATGTRSPILVSPTGSGKSVMGAAIVSELNTNTLWVSHRRELIHQAADHLRSAGLHVGIVLAGEEEDPGAPVQVAAIQTLTRRDLPTAKLIVIDECHHAASEGLRGLLEAFPGVPVLGMTATPFRLDGKPLGDVFSDIVVSATVAELCRMGKLVEPIVFVPPGPDLRGVRITAGDYNLHDLGKAVDREGLVAPIIETWKEKANGRRTVVFAVNVEHSEHIVERFRDAGVEAVHIDGDTPKKLRDAALERLRRHEIDVISNCNLINEGWDLPALEVAIIARPTASLCLHLQMIGRIMRACEGKAGAVVLDHAGNHSIHGSVMREIAYSLTEKIDKKASAEAEKIVSKKCPQCHLIVSRSTRECPECGYVFVSERDLPVEHPGELVVYNEPKPTKEYTFEERKVVWERLVATEEARRYRSGWAMFRFKEMFAVSPFVVRGKLVDPENATQEQEKWFYWEKYVHSRTHLKKDGEPYKECFAAMQYKDIFGSFPPRCWLGLAKAKYDSQCEEKVLF